jgi:hypothetical protein
MVVPLTSKGRVSAAGFKERFPNRSRLSFYKCSIIGSKFQIPPLKVTDFLQPQLLRDTMDDIVKIAQNQKLCGKQLTKNGTP